VETPRPAQSRDAQFSPLATRARAATLAAMAPRTAFERPGRDSGRAPESDPAIRLYDEACALLDAAQGIRAAAAPRRSAPAIAATLGGVEASLDALATAADAMRVAVLVGREGVDIVQTGPDRDALQIRATFAQLERDLEAARSSCATARELVGPFVAWR
jgi:hypothetical protein